MRSAAAISVAFLVAACGQAPETLSECAARFSAIAHRLPSSAAPVRPVYTYDLARMDDESRTRLTTTGLNGRDRPRLSVSNHTSRDAVSTFERSLPGPNGLLFLAPSVSLFRVAGPRQASAGVAIEEGCKMLPGARLRSVSVTAS